MSDEEYYEEEEEYEEEEYEEEEEEEEEEKAIPDEYVLIILPQLSFIIHITSFRRKSVRSAMSE